MKNYLKILGSSFFLGFVFFGLGPILFEKYGFVVAALFAVFVLVPGWIMCHQYAWIFNPQGSPWVDMGWAVVAANLAWAWGRYGVSPLRMVPILVLCGAGIVIGVVAANIVQIGINRHGRKGSSRRETEEST